MERSQFVSEMQDALAKNKLTPLPEVRLETFYAFASHLLEVNQITNLTAIRNFSDVITKHFVDSLLVEPFISQGARVLDLGCGAGFPSLPLAIVRPDLSIVALDSTAKKIAFVNEATSLLGLSNLKAISGRAEDAKILAALGKFDVVTSRAVAALPILSELCLPYAKLGGRFLPLKASKADEEVSAARKGIVFLGGSEPIMHACTLRTQQGEEPRCIIEVTKQKETPKGYPRAYAAILKKPL